MSFKDVITKPLLSLATAKEKRRKRKDEELRMKEELIKKQELDLQNEQVLFNVEDIFVLLLRPRETMGYTSYQSDKTDPLEYLNNGTKMAFVQKKDDGYYLVRDGHKLDYEPYTYDRHAQGYFKSKHGYCIGNEIIITPETSGEHLLKNGYLAVNKHFYNVASICELSIYTLSNGSYLSDMFHNDSCGIGYYPNLKPVNGKFNLRQLLETEDYTNKQIFVNAEKLADDYKKAATNVD